MRKILLATLVFLVSIGFSCTKPDAKAEKSAEEKQPAYQKGALKMVFSPVVAGRFYTADPVKLAEEVEGYIKDAKPPEISEPVMGIVSPHAGYIFSGSVAGYSFKLVKDKKYDVAVVIGLSHQVPGQISVLDYQYYKTPLGKLKIDQKLTKNLISAAPWIDDNEGLFSREHSLEVQLPFIQKALPNVKIVMVSMRSGSLERCRELAKILDRTFAGKKALFIASSDMSHFHPYAAAKKMDTYTLDLIDKMDIETLADNFATRKCEMCGSGPVLTLMELHKLRKGDAEGIKILKYLNSGDTAGSKNEVVGYGAVAFVGTEKSFSQPKEEAKADKTGDENDYLSADDKQFLLQVARKTIESYVHNREKPKFNPTSESLKAPGAAFVTLHKRGNLRGCIGHIIASIPLWECVRDMAIAAATQDPRFSKVKSEEIPDLHIEVSVLTPPETIDDPQRVMVGRHGLIMEQGFKRGLLLPQVPVEWGWDKQTYLAQTCHKAGMSQDCWKDPKTKIQTFEAIVFSE